MIDLSAAGLNPTLSQAYAELVKHPEITPVVFAKRTTQTRTNAYKVLDELVSLGLAERFETGKKLHYRARNPQRLLQLAQIRREVIIEQEKIMTEQVQDLTREFFAISDQPGVQFYQGKESIRKVYFEMLGTGQDLYLIRSPYDQTFYDRELFVELMEERVRRNINTYALTPDVSTATHNPVFDRRHNFFRTWLRPEDYDQPVEWNIAGDKIAIISYGKEAFATLIVSPQIANSMRQLFYLVKTNYPSDSTEG